MTDPNEKAGRKCRHGGIWEQVGENILRCSKCGDHDFITGIDDDVDGDPMTDHTRTGEGVDGR